ncbi:cation:proton antiporter [Loktanella sp. DJP18]|uniref:cation:proton antiporter n=1 Tax=Loktanella sp. DJP18 TaxID=3409788 RepID=UPI003BB58B21
MPIQIIVSALASLFLVSALCQPLAARLKLPLAAVLAIAGIILSIAANWAQSHLIYGPLAKVGETAATVLSLPISSDIFVYVLLPVLLFQGAVGVDIRHLVRDSVAIMLLAILAVLLSIGLIGGAVHLISGISLTACLLLGAIIATTDPSAVISMFRDLGAPARLTRLVEGESLLNDATAIAAFNALLAALLIGATPSWRDFGLQIGTGLIAGAVVGIASGMVVARLLGRLRQFRSAQITLTLITPYILFSACAASPYVSGVVATVAAGITIGAIARSRFDRVDFRFMRELLDQVADWSTGLIFIFAALIVPRILAQASISNMLMLAVVIVTALTARAIILWGVAPLLAAAGLMRPVGHQMSTALLWGGLRGAMTLALVLSVAENTLIAPDVKSVITFLATGYTLWTLLVQGTTLRIIVDRLGLIQLAPVDRALRNQALGRAIDATRDRVRQFARRAGLDTALVENAITPYEKRLKAALNDTSFETEITDKEKLRLALGALVNHERNLLLDQRWSSGLPSSMIDQYLYALDVMRDEARMVGHVGYLRAARLPYRQTAQFRVVSTLYRMTGAEGPLASYIARRFHYLLVNRVLVAQLVWYVDARLKPIFGGRITEIIAEIVSRRREELERNIEAIRLQYPAFAHDLEQSMVQRYAHHEEIAQINTLLDSGVIAPDIARSLIAEAEDLNRSVRRAGHIDIEHAKPELLRMLRLFEGFSDKQLADVAKRMRPAVFAANTTIYKPGDRVDQIYFIANGAVEVDREGDIQRLGRGQAFGQLRVLNPALKPATVRAISYSHCFRMTVKDFRDMLRQQPEWSTGLLSSRVTTTTTTTTTTTAAAAAASAE